MTGFKSDLSFAIVIPARYQSSRFPGKPLADILGKPMIQRVWEQCCKAVSPKFVYVATDSNKIEKVCESFGAQVIITSSACLTGTDRLAEANETIKRDFIINVQGDEPLINPDDIIKVIEEYQSSPETIVNAMCKIKTEEEFRSFTVPKVVTSINGNLLYMSRSPIPLTKNNKFTSAYKQVCIYAFSKESLNIFASFGGKSPIEEVEDIEILRFLENGIPIQMLEVSTGSIAVDVPADIGKVELKLNDIKLR
jgi:3-deoxy-manno-octulosonate cytidylyltransferase (CMP-KDO synthetase)